MIQQHKYAYQIMVMAILCVLMAGSALENIKFVQSVTESKNPYHLSQLQQSHLLSFYSNISKKQNTTLIQIPHTDFIKMSARTTPTTITFDEENIRHPAGTVFIDDDDKEHAQDWTSVTAPKDTWAARERRRSSVWSRIDENNPHTSKVPDSKTAAPRRGSILSVWAPGKDSKGRSILKHDDSDEDEEVIMVEEVPVVEKQGRRSTSGGQERRGSILSLWSKGVDEKGRAIVLHDDEEWK